MMQFACVLDGALLSLDYLGARGGTTPLSRGANQLDDVASGLVSGVRLPLALVPLVAAN